MKSAQRIMRKRRFIKARMDKVLPKQQSDAIWQDATERLEEILCRYEALPKGVRGHTDTFIFPAAAIYLTVRDAVGVGTAYAIIEESAISASGDAGRKLEKLMRVPGMRSLFISVWDPLTRKKFGQSNGFQNVFYPKRKGEFRMDVTACPYCRYFGELGCPELTKVFCANDDRVYGSLPGIVFERTGTLGRGADCCDFRIRKA